MAELIRKINSLPYPRLNLLINICLILICIEVALNTKEMNNLAILATYGFVGISFYFFNRNADID